MVAGSAASIGRSPVLVDMREVRSASWMKQTPGLAGQRARVSGCSSGLRTDSLEGQRSRSHRRSPIEIKDRRATNVTACEDQTEDLQERTGYEGRIVAVSVGDNGHKMSSEMSSTLQQAPP